MRPFSYAQPTDAPSSVIAAVTQHGASDLRADGNAAYLAGGTSLIDLMKLDVMKPSQLININALDKDHSEISVTTGGLRLGALARMATIADHPDVIREYPIVAESLKQAASAQIRNMASIGGNVLQRTRCSYFRDTSYQACNKRSPGSGCAAIGGINRIHAVLGTTQNCIASYPGDFAQALVAMDGQLELLGPNGARVISFAQLHRTTSETPDIETNLRPGEIIIAITIPAGPHARRSAYVKVRDRESYAFALVSAAVALDVSPDNVVRDVRIGLGGVHYAPFRANAAEDVLRGQSLTEEHASAAAQAALEGSVAHGHNNFKPELARRTLIRALMQVRDMPIVQGAAQP